MKHPIMVIDPIRTGALKLHYYPVKSLQPGASTWMILTHLIWINGLSAAELNSLLWPTVKTRKQRPFNSDLNLPRWRVSHPGTPLEEAYSSLQAANGFSSGHPMAGYQETCLRYCAECLAQGIHVLIFQWTFIAVCPLHRLPLITHCRQCHQPVAYRFNAETFKLPGHCPHCFNALMDSASVVRLNRRPLKIFQSLLDFSRSLQQSLRNCHDNSQLKCLSSWFKIFPATYPVLRIGHRQSYTWQYPTPGFYQYRCKTVMEDIHRCYRSIRHGLWRQFSRTERRQLRFWVQTHPDVMYEPNTTTLSRRQATYLFWRMVWEGRTKPGSLFQRSLAPYTGLWVWRLLNLFEEENEDNGKITALESKELQAFNEALSYTYKICDHLAGRMLARNQICFDQNWVGIPSNFLPSPPFFKVSLGLLVKN